MQMDRLVGFLKPAEHQRNPHKIQFAHKS